MQTISIRLLPKQDLKKQILKLIEDHKIQAGVILSSVGSLEKANVRLASDSQGHNEVVSFTGPFEIISLNGTLAANGVHLHLSFSDKAGQVRGGHLLDDCLIYTTCELVIGLLPDTKFQRETDSATQYLELKIQKRMP